MSLLLFSLYKKSQKNDILSTSVANKNPPSSNNSNAWLISYIALFTSLLAFFILTISLLNLETSAPKRSYENLVHSLEKQLAYEAQQQNLSWLQIEANTTKGIRISFPPNLIKGQNLFASASAQINPRYLPYLRSLLPLMQTANEEALQQRYQSLIQQIERENYQLKFIWRIEGHTDANVMAENARFQSNVELSAYRAYAMMEWLRIRLALPKSQFAIAGYGSFQPITDNPLEAENRRIEIYLLPQLIPHEQENLVPESAEEAL